MRRPRARDAGTNLASRIALCWQLYDAFNRSQSRFWPAYSPTLVEAGYGPSGAIMFPTDAGTGATVQGCDQVKAACTTHLVF